MQLLARWLGDDVDPAIERIVFVEQHQIRAPAAEKLGEHFPEIDPHLGESFGEELFGRLIDSRDDVEQLAPRVR